MKLTNIVKTTLVLASLLSLNTSCKKWLDVNKNPNDLEQDKATLQLALPSAEYTIAYVVGNKYAEIGGFLSQYYTQKPSATQFFDYDRYSFDANDADREWGQLYAGALRDLNFIVDQGKSSGDSNYVAAAKILQAYTFQLITDVHGDVPFSEALLAQSGNIAPNYDAQSAIYDGCVVLLNDAIDYISLSSKTHPGTDDVIFGGNMRLWLKFANSLKLKLAMRQSDVRSTTTAAILNSLTNADFLEAGEVALIQFTNTKGNQNPLYASILSLGDNNVASKAIADSLNTWQDPRAAAFYEEASFSAVGINGIAQGAAAENPGSFPANTPVSEMSSSILGATIPVILMSNWEVKFLLAEAKANSLYSSTTSSAQEDYEEAIVNNMEYFGIDTTGLGLFTMAPYMWETAPKDQIKQIAVQKWVAFCGTQNMESWTELRRLKMPVLSTSLASQLPANVFPQRIPYAAGEETTNPNFPGQELITTKMWWTK